MRRRSCCLTSRSVAIISARLFAEAIRHCRKDTGNGGKALEFRKIPMKKMVVDTGKIIVNRL
jgi:hypothetical protein